MITSSPCRANCSSSSTGSSTRSTGSSPTQRRFTCRLCSKSFRSHQALGGHSTSHNQYSSKSSSCDHRMHCCPLCDAKFAKGQALGGHMRKHRHETLAAAPTSPNPPTMKKRTTEEEEEEEENQETDCWLSLTLSAGPVKRGANLQPPLKKPKIDVGAQYHQSPEEQDKKIDVDLELRLGLCGRR
ncbi:hypothetical protein Dimus_009087 [Dionaea muscipula]